MSKNSKSAKRHAQARAVSAQRKGGGKLGMSQKKTTKRLTWDARKDGKLGGALLAAAERFAARREAGEPAEE